MQRLLVSLGLCGAIALAALAAAGETPTDAEARIQAIRDQAHTLSDLAHEPLPESLDPKERRRAEAFGKWLEKTSLELTAFAERWEAAVRRRPHRTAERAVAGDTRAEGVPQATREMQEQDQSFALQYSYLQNRIQQETREFNLISNIMKMRHEAAKQAIQNVR